LKSKSVIFIVLLLGTISTPVQAQSVPAPTIRSSIMTPANQIDADLVPVGNLIKMGEIQQAITILDRMLVTYGNDPRLRTYYKLAYKAGKRYPELERIIKADLEQEPQNPYFLTELAEAKFLQNDEPAAESLWNQAIKFGSQDENSYRFVAENMMVYGLYESAIDIYLKARQNLRNPAAFSMELANLYETQKDYNKAIGEYLSQVIQDPSQLGMVTIKIRGYLEDSDNPQRIIDAVSERMKETSNHPELYEILGDLYIKLNKMDKALECFKTISTDQNDDGAALIKFANRAYESKSYVTAINAVDEYFKISKKTASRETASLIRAKSQFAASRIDDAQAGFLQLFVTAADYRIKDEAGLSAGLIYAQHKDDCDSALIIWNSMQSSAKDIVFQGRAWLEMAICDLKKDNYDSAEDLLKQITSTKLPDSSMQKAIFFLGELSFYRENFKDAEEIFKQLIKQYSQGDYSNDALIRMDVISTCGDSDVNKKFLSLFAQAMKAQDLGHPLNAAAILSDSVLAGSPIAEQALFYAASAFANGGNHESALSAFKGYIEKFPEGLYIDRAYLGLGDIYMQEPTTYGSAKAAFDKILEAFPEGPVTEVARQRLLQLNAAGKIG
jgi:tetratricopeptide (TPR) repeat protein